VQVALLEGSHPPVVVLGLAVVDVLGLEEDLVVVLFLVAVEILVKPFQEYPVMTTQYLLKFRKLPSCVMAKWRVATMLTQRLTARLSTSVLPMLRVV